MNLRRAAVLVFAALPALSAAADPSGGLIAAPGDCAQPLSDLVTAQIYGQSAGVAGPASDHFAPRDVTGSLLNLLPLDLTRTGQTGSSLSDVSAAAPQLVDPISQSPVLNLESITNDPLPLDPIGGGPGGPGPVTNTLNEVTSGLGLGGDK